EVERISNFRWIDVRPTQCVIDAAMCQRSSNLHRGQMCLRIMTTVSRSENHTCRVEHDLAVDRPILHDKPDMAIVQNHPLEMRMECRAGGTGVIEKLDNRNVAIGVSKDGLRGVVSHVV